jgi:antitoxin component of MazEF toxin-antitoxin module
LPRNNIIQHIYQHGSSLGVTIPRTVLLHLDWAAGDFVVVELQENKQGILVRRAQPADLYGHRAPRVSEPSAPAVP